jgi:heat shock protein HslJ
MREKLVMGLVRLVALALSAAAMTATAQAQPAGGRSKPPQSQQSPEQKPSILQKQDKQFPVPSSWVALTLNGKAYSGFDRPTFSLDKQYRGRGFGGCNTFSTTSYPLREQHFAVGPLALTKKQCDKAVMEAERTYFIALRTAAQWDLEGTILVIKGPNGELRFERSI